MASFLSTYNLSLYTIPAAWVLAMVPHFYAISLAGKKFDDKHPRGFTASLKDDQTLDSVTKQTIVRAEGAQSNGFENLGLYAAAIVAGNMSLLPTTTLNYLSVGYLMSRVVYNLIYINGSSDGLAKARTGVYLSGIGCIFGLFIKSGNVLVGGVKI